MDALTLGRTGLRVSIAGLGCGGHSRLGSAYGRSDEECAAVVRRAYDLGVTLFDTAECYQTEPYVALGLRGVPRDKVVICTKKSTWSDGDPLSETSIVASLHASLKRLDTDYIDIYQMHGVSASAYPRVREECVPVLQRLRDQGLIRFLGITEAFGGDTGHRMLDMALADDCWDTVMVGHNLLNPSARDRVFPRTREKDVGTLVMFAVRKALSCPQRLRKVIGELVEHEQVDPAAVNLNAPLDFLLRESDAASIPEAAYRYCRHTAGADVVLTGTGSIEHLEDNLSALAKPPLPHPVLARLEYIFGHVDTVSGG